MVIKTIDEQLLPIKEAIKVIKGYVAEAEAITKDGQLTIFNT